MLWDEPKIFFLERRYFFSIILSEFLKNRVALQSDSVSEELDTENVQCALDFENTMNELETQLYYRHLPPKEVALRVMEAACKFYDADWCGLI